MSVSALMRAAEAIEGRNPQLAELYRRKAGLAQQAWGGDERPEDDKALSLHDLDLTRKAEDHA